ncbi:MAG: DUF1273 family protein [Clostridia bacterium]|nr:DUF1273 family protein [Clostridia bacterium]
MENTKKITCAFTGHRPERLDATEIKVKNWLTEQIEKAAGDGYRRFISGMQRGVDLWAAQAVLELRERMPDVKLIAASAFRGMENSSDWNDEWRAVYKKVIGAANEVHFIGAIPGRVSYFMRNDWMVDRASRLIAVSTGAPGGTQKTIDRARRLGLEIISFQ